MNLLDLKCEKKENYKWGREVSGIWHHWEMSVLEGHAVLHVEGIDKQFRGAIQLNNEFNPDRESIYTTLDAGYEPFDTPDKCAEILEHQWREIINTEARLMLT
jgi:hypothetical protein